MRSQEAEADSGRDRGKKLMRATRNLAQTFFLSKAFRLEQGRCQEHESYPVF